MVGIQTIHATGTPPTQDLGGLPYPLGKQQRPAVSCLDLSSGSLSEQTLAMKAGEGRLATESCRTSQA